MVSLKVEWSVEAKIDLFDILEFYIVRNGNSIYSKKLSARINKSIKLLSKNPRLGKQTDEPQVRILITGDYHIIYEVFTKVILIIMIWDNRRDPENKTIDSRKK